MEILGAIIIGAAAGWLGGLIYKGSGLGFIGNIVVGIFCVQSNEASWPF